jgi:aspartate-semialdehyde dehydrogenase
MKIFHHLRKSTNKISSKLTTKLIHCSPLLERNYDDNKTPFKRSLSMADEKLKEHFFGSSQRDQNNLPPPPMATKRNGMKNPVVAIAGATGAVGIEMRKCLKELNFPVHSLRVFAHPSEEGDLVEFNGHYYPCEVVKDNSFDNIDIALFSAGGVFSKEWAPKAAAAGCVVVDNSPEFRMDPNVPLIVPEVNGHAVKKHNNILANPNCTTILMNVPVYPLHKAFGVKRAVVSTYQAASGAGLDAMNELEQQAKDWVHKKPLTQDIFGRQYIWNLFNHNSPQYEDNGYNQEEWKMIEETPKIFEGPFKVAVTCVRVPVLRAHCESINLQFKKKVTLEEVYDVLQNSKGIRIVDDRINNKHPEPLDASGEFEILVGRIRYDQSLEEGYGIDMFIAGDQLLKGAALNAVQIAELLIQE